MKISVFAHTANPLTDRPMVRKSRSYIKNLLETLAARIIDGKTPEDTLAIQLYAPIDRMAHVGTLVERVSGWNMPSYMEHAGLNRGGSGQNVASYPIPYVFEGHIKPMRVAVINAGDPLHA
jgi:hypothetical protein